VDPAAAAAAAATVSVITFTCEDSVPVQEDFKFEFFHGSLFGKKSLFHCWINTRFCHEGALIISKGVCASYVLGE